MYSLDGRTCKFRLNFCAITLHICTSTSADIQVHSSAIFHTAALLGKVQVRHQKNGISSESSIGDTFHLLNTEKSTFSISLIANSISECSLTELKKGPLSVIHRIFTF